MTSTPLAAAASITGSTSATPDPVSTSATSAPPANASAAPATTVTPHAPTPATSPASRPALAGSATAASRSPGRAWTAFSTSRPIAPSPTIATRTIAPPVPRLTRPPSFPSVIGSLGFTWDHLGSLAELGQIVAQLLEEHRDLRGGQRIEAAADAFQLVAQAAGALAVVAERVLEPARGGVRRPRVRNAGGHRLQLLGGGLVVTVAVLRRVAARVLG